MTKNQSEKTQFAYEHRLWLGTTLEKNEVIGGTNDEGANPKLASERQLTSLSNYSRCLERIASCHIISMEEKLTKKSKIEFLNKYGLL